MTTFNITATLNGSSSFAFGSLGTLSWQGRFLRSIDLWDGNPDNTYNINMTLTGNNWQIRDLSVGGNAQQNLLITDANQGVGRFLELVNLNTAISAVLDLQTTSARAIMGFAGQHDFSLGGGWFGHIGLNNSVSNTVSNGPGGMIESLNLGGPQDETISNSVDIGGRAGAIRIWRGDNEIAVNGRAENLRISEAARNDITVNGRLDSIRLNDAMEQAEAGVNTLTLGQNARVEFLRITADWTDASETEVRMNTNTITSARNGNARLDNVEIWGGINSFDLGGRTKSMVLEQSISTVLVRDGGWIDQIRGDGDTSLDLRGDARALMVKLDHGTQVLRTANGNVESYFAHNSSSTLNIGAGGLQQAVLSGAGGAQSVNAVGFIGSLQIRRGNDADLTFAGGFGNLLLSADSTYRIIVQDGLGDDRWNGSITAFGQADITNGRGTIDAIRTGDQDDRIVTGAGAVGTIHAGAGDDFIRLGSGGAELVNAGDGNDTVQGSNRDDLIYGGAGNDRLDGRGGDDLIFGGSGNDRIQGGGGDDTLYGGAGADTLFGDSGDDLIFGGGGADRLNGGGGDDTLDGGGGNDTLNGDGGHDLLYGGGGDDVLFGGAGRDTLFGGAGNDTLSGGAGADVFAFGRGDGQNRITDFSTDDGDRLWLGSDLWRGTLTAAEVVDRFGSVSAAGHLRLDFDRGERIVIENGAGITDLADHITII